MKVLQRIDRAIWHGDAGELISKALIVFAIGYFVGLVVRALVWTHGGF